MVVRSMMIVIAVSSPCFGSIDCLAFINTGGQIAQRSDGGTFGDRNGTLVYDNATFPSQGGSTLFVDFPRYNRAEIGDDLHLAMTGSGILTDGLWAIRNMSFTDTLERITVIHRWYDAAGNRLGELNESLILGGGLPPRSVGQIETQGNLYRHLNIPLNGAIRWSLEFTDLQGMSFDDLALVVAGPNTLGSSSSLLHNYTTGQDIDLGRNDANLMFKVSSAPAPAPTAGALGILSAIMACRRRR